MAGVFSHARACLLSGDNMLQILSNGPAFPHPALLSPLAEEEPSSSFTTNRPLSFMPASCSCHWPGCHPSNLFSSAGFSVDQGRLSRSPGCSWSVLEAAQM
ncbi:unnamed protein product, partial [Prorocentrum cordatum]